MAKRSLSQRLRSTAQVRLALFILGVLMMAIAPVVGILHPAEDQKDHAEPRAGCRFAGLLSPGRGTRRLLAGSP